MKMKKSTLQYRQTNLRSLKRAITSQSPGNSFLLLFASIFSAATLESSIRVLFSSPKIGINARVYFNHVSIPFCVLFFCHLISLFNRLERVYSEPTERINAPTSVKKINPLSNPLPRLPTLSYIETEPQLIYAKNTHRRKNNKNKKDRDRARAFYMIIRTGL